MYNDIEKLKDICKKYNITISDIFYSINQNENIKKLNDITNDHDANILLYSISDLDLIYDTINKYHIYKDTLVYVILKIIHTSRHIDIDKKICIFSKIYSIDPYIMNVFIDISNEKFHSNKWNIYAKNYNDIFKFYTKITNKHLKSNLINELKYIFDIYTYVPEGELLTINNYNKIEITGPFRYLIGKNIPEFVY